MTSEEEKMQDYLRQSKQREGTKKSKPKNAAAKTDDDDDKPSPMTPTTYYVRHVIFYLIRAALLTFAIIAIASLAYSAMYKTNDETLVYLLYLAIAIYTAAVLWKVLNIITYARWVGGKLYPMKGWSEFLSRRSEDYPKGSYYTRIRIIVRLAPDATPMHQQVTTTFMKDFAEQKLGIPYSKMGWEPGSSVPKDFSSDKNVVSGDIGMRSLQRVVRKMCYDMPKLTAMLGKSLQVVEIESETTERKCETVRVSRSDD